MRIAKLLLVSIVSWPWGLSAEQPPDPLDGPPFVSCRAWAIVDGKSGELLWGQNEDLGLKAASTTKIMCAHVVLELAKRHASVLDETVTFSELADKTPGSTAGVRAGESLSVRECLYGLLLPSGNDAGNALAEHFHDRLAQPERKSGDTETDHRGAALATRANFIAQMNRTAQSLGMTKTTYRSPYGDGGSDQDHTTSPRDLLRLTWMAMQNPAFCQYVATQRHETQLRQPDGNTRAIVWQNTNQLLKKDGYDGVKTGTTSLAGSCLVSSGRRGEDHLLVAVLGSTSNEGRYVDTKNLFRWAWLERGHRR